MHRILGSALAVLLLSLAPTVAHAEPDPASAQLEAAVNTYRTSQALPPLDHADDLARSAQAYAVYQAQTGCLGHGCGGDETRAEWTTRHFGALAYATVQTGEDLYAGYGTPERVAQAWEGSAPHRAVLLADVTSEGVGWAEVTRPLFSGPAVEGVSAAALYGFGPGARVWVLHVAGRFGPRSKGGED